MMTLTDEITAIARLIESAWQLIQAREGDEEHQASLEEWQDYKETLLQHYGQSETLSYLKCAFELEQWQLMLLMLVALPALDARYRALYQDLNPSGQPEPALGWLLDLLSETPEQKREWCQTLSEQSPLIQYRLILTPDNAGYWLSGSVSISQDLLAYLLEQPLWSSDSHQCMSRVEMPGHELLSPETEPDAQCIQLTGAKGSGRTTYSLYFSGKAGHSLLRINNERFWEFADLRRALSDILRYVTLARAELLWPNGLSALAEHSAEEQLLFEWLQADEDRRVWFLAETSEDWPSQLIRLKPCKVPIKQGSATRMTELCQVMAKSFDSVSDSVDWRLISQRYRLSPGDMVQVLAGMHEQGREVTTSLVLQECLKRTPASLSGLATRVTPSSSFSDLVLVPDVAAQLHELTERHRLRQRLCESGISRVTGLMALFSGQPGTGKTMAAEALASELSLPLYRVNLANVASKWIGETEKHLDSLFEEVEFYNGILFFDEADAIFARRSEVNSSHDKNANMGVSYLLQRIESFNGLLILATNFKGNLDKAFLRRLQFSIEFVQPDVSARRELWKRWLSLVPVQSEVDTGALASRLELSGAQIRNITQQAMTLALIENEQQPKVSPENLVQAIRREFQKNDTSFLVGQKLAGLFDSGEEREKAS